MLDINTAEEFVKSKNIKSISASQIRKFLAAVNKINNKVKYQNDNEVLSNDIVDEIAYMRVQFAYIVGKNNTNEMKELYKKLDPAMAEIKTSKAAFINFARYVEAIIAYHKFHGGKD
ncbi:type III-A CRISPR-associated protein Csm2 [Brachyspira innocens]|uniref:type III-A CRISPR-associated protein Csm2 n=1 Tax=Brachyspira innocens TaxID=13264 RepID=UPI0026F32724|nr:type III-A CRISPR-associated protein Csm2 [Brachyspira innocens]